MELPLFGSSCLAGPPQETMNSFHLTIALGTALKAVAAMVFVRTSA